MRCVRACPPPVPPVVLDQKETLSLSLSPNSRHGICAVCDHTVHFIIQEYIYIYICDMMLHCHDIMVREEPPRKNTREKTEKTHAQIRTDTPP